MWTNVGERGKQEGGYKGWVYVLVVRVEGQSPVRQGEAPLLLWQSVCTVIERKKMFQYSGKL